MFSKLKAAIMSHGVPSTMFENIPTINQDHVVSEKCDKAFKSILCWHGLTCKMPTGIKGNESKSKMKHTIRLYADGVLAC